MRNPEILMAPIAARSDQFGRRLKPARQGRGWATFARRRPRQFDRAGGLRLSFRLSATRYSFMSKRWSDLPLPRCPAAL